MVSYKCIAGILTLLHFFGHGSAQDSFKSAYLDAAEEDLTSIKNTYLSGSSIPLNYIITNTESIEYRMDRARAQTRNQVNTVASSLTDAINVNSTYNQDVDNSVNVTVGGLVDECGVEVYPQIPDFTSEKQQLYDIWVNHTTQLNIFMGYTKSNLSEECDNIDIIEFSQCVDAKVAAFNASCQDYYATIRETATLSIETLQYVDSVYNPWLATGIHDICVHIKEKSNSNAQYIYDSADITDDKLLEYGNVKMQATIETYEGTINDLTVNISDYYVSIKAIFTDYPDYFSPTVLQEKIDNLNSTVETRYRISEMSEPQHSEFTDELDTIISNYVSLFVSTVESYQTLLENTNTYATNNQTKATQIKNDNNSTNYQTVDTDFFTCYNSSSPTPSENLMTCINKLRYSVKVELVRITNHLKSLQQLITTLNTVPFLLLQSQFVFYADREIKELLEVVSQYEQ